jgi:Protein of unknown function (DUF3593)/Protein of unknown function (DUF2499)
MISPSDISSVMALPSTSIGALVSSLHDMNFSIDSNAAEALAGPFFGLSLFPYLAFLYFLSVEENETPKGVVAGFATCLLFVVLTIPAAIAAKVLYGESLANCDWLHSSAESLLTLTNLVLVVAFRQALEAKESGTPPPPSSTSYGPAVSWVVAGTALATATVLSPALSHPQVHTPYLGGFLDLPFLGISEPDNALTVATWIIHISSLVEFLVAMGFCWRWADVVQNPTWKGLTWGLLPLHSSGITACTYHLFYNRIALLLPLQALLTCVGNTTAAYAAYRIARSNGWSPPSALSAFVGTTDDSLVKRSDKLATQGESPSLVGFEDLGDALRGDNDSSFLIKLFVGCGIASYAIKYGETFFSFPLDENVLLALAFVFVPSGLNAFKWYKRSRDPTFEGWF